MQGNRIIPLSLLIAAAACAPRSRTPVPEAAHPVATVPSTIAETAIVNRIPAFKTEPLVTWGAPPAGIEHPLPAKTVDLEHQIMRIRFDWSRKAVTGSTTLRMVVLDKPVSSVTLDAVGMDIKGVHSAQGTLKHQYDGTHLTVNFPKPLQPRESVAITVDYEAVAPKRGTYFIPRKHVVWTQGEMIETRHWIPTFDRPDDKTTWEFFVTVPANEKVLSNGRLVGTRKIGNDVEWHWSQEKPASTYLYSVVAGDYEVIRDQWDGIPVGYWTYPDSVEAAKRGFKGTPDMMRVFSQMTGVRYPWAKYDQSAVPDFTFGGMENVSATTQNDKRVLIPASDSLRDAQALVSHELAHQWFGDLVTLDDWSQAWLNEGFATFMETVYFEQSGQMERAALNRLNDQQQALRADLKARRPLVYGRWDKDPLELFLTGHIYPRGAAVLDMLRFTVGDSLFWKSINAYLTQHAYGNVVSEDLRSAFERVTGRDLKPFFQQWVYGAGYPAFRIAQKYDASTKQLVLTATQVQPRDSLTGFFTMDVPVEVMTDSGDVRAIAQVRGETTTVTIPLRSAPRAIRWDPDDRWLDVIDFPRSTSMLLYQLASGDVLARAEAIALLKERRDQPGVRAALERVANTDTSRDIRVRAKAAIGG